MALWVKKVKGPYEVSFEWKGFGELWERLPMAERRLYWGAFWKGYKAAGGKLQDSMFGFPDNKGASLKSRAVHSAFFIVELWNRNKSGSDLEDKAILAGCQEIAKEWSYNGGHTIGGNLIAEDYASSVLFSRPPLLAFEPSDKTATELVVGGVKAAGTAVKKKVVGNASNFEIAAGLSIGTIAAGGVLFVLWKLANK